MALPVSRRTFLFAGASLATYRLASAQDSSKDATFSSDVNVVNVFATVHDKQGKIIRTLGKEDFFLEDEGHPQPIQYFAQQSDLPLTLGLLIDTSGSQRNVLEPERHASYRFLEQVMRPEKDKAFVIHFDYEVELLQDLTSSKKDLEASLDDLSVSRPQMNRRGQGGQGGGGGYPGGGSYPGGGGGRSGGRGGGTDLYDAVLLASDDMMKKQQGRKAVFVLSDGVDTGSKVTLNDAIESAQKSDTLVYAIRFYDQGSYGGGGQRGGFGGPSIGIPGIGGIGGGGGRRGGGGAPGRANLPDGKKVLQRLAEETGGGYYEVSSKHTLGDIYDAIEDELRNQYSLGFNSPKDSPGFHRLKVGTKDKSLIAQARGGYYAR
jgi:VWFA-related protein